MAGAGADGAPILRCSSQFVVEAHCAIPGRNFVEGEMPLRVSGASLIQRQRGALSSFFAVTPVKGLLNDQLSLRLWPVFHYPSNMTPWPQRDLPIRRLLIRLDLDESFIVGSHQRLQFSLGRELKMSLRIGSHGIAMPIIRAEFAVW